MLSTLPFLGGCLPGESIGEDAPIPGPAANPKDFGASGSAAVYGVSVTAGSKEISLGAASDFQKGQGIVVYHGGTPCNIAGADCAAIELPAPQVSTCPASSPGPASYFYRIAALDGRGGLTAAGAIASVAGTFPLSPAQCNLVDWPRVKGASAYAIYRSINKGPFRLISITQREFKDVDVGQYPSNASVPLEALDSVSADHLMTKVALASRGRIELEQAPRQSLTRTRVSHDDTEAFRAALSAGAFKAVRIPPGVYVLGGPLHMPRGLIIYGNGARSSFKRADFYPGSVFSLDEDSAGTAFRNLAYDGNGSAFKGISGAFIYLGGSRGVALKSLMLRDLCGPALSGSGSDTSVSGSFIAAGLCGGQAIPALNLDAGTQVKIEDNRLIGAVNAGTVAGLSMGNNELEGNLYAAGPGFWIWDNSISEDAVLSGNGSFGNNRAAKIIIAARDQNVDGIEIEGNTLTGSGGSGLEFWMRGPDAAVSAISVLNNHWTGRPLHAVAFPADSARVSGVSFEGNSFSFSQAPYAGALPQGTVGQLANPR